MNKKTFFRSFFISFFMIVSMLFALFIVVSQGDHAYARESVSITDIYIVNKGDTLWDISERFFGDPFLWPSLWQKNPHIKDPHWIYPGEIINLLELPLLTSHGLKLMKPSFKPPKKEDVEAKPEIVIPPVEEAYLVSQDRIDSCSYIIPKQVVSYRERTEDWGRIIKCREDKLNLSYLDDVYLDLGDDKVKTGQVLTIFRVEEELEGPGKSKIPYSMIRILGKAEVKEVYPNLSLARIMKSYREISVGDRVKPYEVIPRPILTPTEIKGLEGELMAGEGQQNYLTEYDLVFLNIGARDGLEQGNPLEIYRFEQIQVGPKDTNITRVAKKLGNLLVLRVEEETATGMIDKSLQPIILGDLVRVRQN